MDIPIQNIYYLLCYAWDQLDEGRVVDVEGVDSPELADLFGHVLASGTRHVLRRGLDRGYVPVREDTPRLKGRIDFDETLRRMLLPRAQAHCHYDELSHDVLHNRILKSTLRRLAVVEGLDPALRDELVRLSHRFPGVRDIQLSGLVFRRVQLYSGNAFYRFLINVCELVYTSTLATEAAGAHRFRDFLRDEEKMWRLFERFVTNFYRHEQDVYEVDEQQTFRWDVTRATPGTDDLIPDMRADVVLRGPERVVILDTKYYRRSTQQSQYGTERFHAPHLYQLFAYLKNSERKGSLYERAEGLILYPTVGQKLDYSFETHGHRIRLVTINLAQVWTGIRVDLLGLLRLSSWEEAYVA